MIFHITAPKKEYLALDTAYSAARFLLIRMVGHVWFCASPCRALVLKAERIRTGKLFMKTAKPSPMNGHFSAIFTFSGDHRYVSAFALSNQLHTLEYSTRSIARSGAGRAGNTNARQNCDLLLPFCNLATISATNELPTRIADRC
jgi:hypothetical protein